MEKQRRDTENLKAELISVLKNAPLYGVAKGVEITNVYESPKKVFEDFTIDETQQQFMYQPYAGFRIDGEISIEMPCEML